MEGGTTRGMGRLIRAPRPHQGTAAEPRGDDRQGRPPGLRRLEITRSGRVVAVIAFTVEVHMTVDDAQKELGIGAVALVVQGHVERDPKRRGGGQEPDENHREDEGVAMRSAQHGAGV